MCQTTDMPNMFSAPCSKAIPALAPAHPSLLHSLAPAPSPSQAGSPSRAQLRKDKVKE